MYSESIDGKDWLPFVNCTFDGAPELQKVWHGAVSRDNLYRFVFVEDSGKSKEILYTESADGTTWQEPRTIIRRISGQHSIALAFYIVTAIFIAFMAL